MPTDRLWHFSIEYDVADLPEEARDRIRECLLQYGPLASPLTRGANLALKISISGPDLSLNDAHSMAFKEARAAIRGSGYERMRFMIVTQVWDGEGPVD